MYNFHEHLGNINSGIKALIQNGGNQSVSNVFKARIHISNNKDKWIQSDTIQGIADEAFFYGQQYKGPIAVPKFEKYALYVLDKYKKGTVKQSTYNGYVSYLKNYMIPVFGDCYITEITAPMIQDYLNNFKDLAYKTLSEHLKFLIQIFDYGIGEGYLDLNPANNKIIAIPTRRVTQRYCLGEEEIRDIMTTMGSLDDEDAKLIAILLYTGMRRGEVLGLRYSDIDDKFIRVNREALYLNANRASVDEEGKTAAAKRWIPIIDLLRPYLDEGSDNQYVIGRKESPISLQVFRNTWSRINKKIDLYNATPHIFRHTFTTIANNSEVDLKSIKTIVGHSTTDVTLGRYTHSTEKQLLEAGGRINEEYVRIYNSLEAL